MRIAGIVRVGRGVAVFLFKLHVNRRSGTLSDDGTSERFFDYVLKKTIKN